MTLVRLKHQLSDISGVIVRAGACLYIQRRYQTDAGERLQLGHSDGRVVLPCVEPGDVEDVR